MNYFLGILAFACVAACQNKPLENKPKVSILEKEKKEICKTSGTFSELVLERRIHAIDPLIKEEKDVYDVDIYSPKSAIYSKDGTKFYVNSLEGYATVVYDANSFKKIKTIKYHFSDKNKHLFKNNENTAFDYQFKQKKDNFNHFLATFKYTHSDITSEQINNIVHKNTSSGLLLFIITLNKLKILFL